MVPTRGLVHPWLSEPVWVPENAWPSKTTDNHSRPEEENEENSDRHRDRVSFGHEVMFKMLFWNHWELILQLILIIWQIKGCRKRCPIIRLCNAISSWPIGIMKLRMLKKTHCALFILKVSWSTLKIVAFLPLGCEFMVKLYCGIWWRDPCLHLLDIFLLIPFALWIHFSRSQSYFLDEKVVFYIFFEVLDILRLSLTYVCVIFYE